MRLQKKRVVGAFLPPPGSGSRVRQNTGWFSVWAFCPHSYECGYKKGGLSQTVVIAYLPPPSSGSRVRKNAGCLLSLPFFPHSYECGYKKSGLSVRFCPRLIWVAVFVRTRVVFCLCLSSRILTNAATKKAGCQCVSAPA